MLKARNVVSLERDPQSHKGDYGHVFVLAGSRGMAGAAVLASEAAARAGAGKVTLGTPKEVYPIAAKRLLEVMTLPLPQGPQGAFSGTALVPALRFAVKTDAVALGPGLSLCPGVRSLVAGIWKRFHGPLVVDADGINALASLPGALAARRKCLAVLTPHDGEFARLSGRRPPADLEGRKGVAKSFSKKYHCVLVLKGHRTIVSSPDGRSYVNRTGNAGMATGGSGDVLTGAIAAFLARVFVPYLASCLAVHVHGAAGDRAARKRGQTSLLARDILSELPAVLKTLERKRRLRQAIGA